MSSDFKAPAEPGATDVDAVERRLRQKYGLSTPGRPPPAAMDERTKRLEAILIPVCEDERRLRQQSRMIPCSPFADMNRDGVFTMTDVAEGLDCWTHLPFRTMDAKARCVGDLIIRWLLDAHPQVALFFELSPASYGGSASVWVVVAIIAVVTATLASLRHAARLALLAFFGVAYVLVVLFSGCITAGNFLVRRTAKRL